MRRLSTRRVHAVGFLNSLTRPTLLESRCYPITLAPRMASIFVSQERVPHRRPDQDDACRRRQTFYLLVACVNRNL